MLQIVCISNTKQITSYTHLEIANNFLSRVSDSSLIYEMYVKFTPLMRKLENQLEIHTHLHICMCTHTHTHTNKDTD